MNDFFCTSKKRSLLVFFLVITLSGALNIIAYFWISFVWSSNLANNNSQFFYFFILVGIEVLNCLVIWASNYRLILIGLTAAKIFHKKMLVSLLRSNCEFFENNEIVTLSHLFVGDLSVVESSLPKSVYVLIMLCVRIVSILLTVSVVSPFFLLSFLPVFGLLFLCEVLFLILLFDC